MTERTVRVNLIGDSTSLVNAANAARTSLQGLARVNIGSVSGGIRNVGNAAQAAGAQTSNLSKALATGLSVVGIQAGVQGLVQGFKAVVGAGLEYQGNMNTLAAVTGASNAQMARLGARAKELGNDIKIPGANAATATEAMKELAKGGLTVAQSMGAAKGTLLLAAAAQVDGATAATIQAKALNAFRLGAESATHVADLLANGANAASGEVTDMAMALQQSATVAAGFGISVDETTVSLALFAKNGIIGSDAGTSLKTMLSALASPTKVQKVAMDDLNVSIYDAQGNFIGMEKLTEQLAKAHGRLTTAQYNQAASTLFGTDAIRAANILGAEGTKGWDKMATAVTAEGGAAKLAASQTVGLNGALDRMVNVAQTASLELFERLQPAMIMAAEIGTKLAIGLGALGSAFGMLPGPVQTFTLGLAAVVLLRGPLLALWASSVAGLTSLKTAFTSTGAVALWFKGEMLVARLSMSALAAQAGIAGVAFNVFGARVKVAAQFMKAAFLTNPIGIILVAATTALSLFMMATEDATEETIDFSDAIDENTGKLKENAGQIVAGKVGDQAAVYQSLGGTLGGYTAALLGNQIAGDKFHTLLIDQAEAAILNGNALQVAVQQGVIPATASARDLAVAILDGTAANYASTPALDKVVGLSKDFAKQQGELASETGSTAGAMAEATAAADIMAGSNSRLTAISSDMDAAIKKVNDELGDGPVSSIAFKTAIDGVRNAMSQADLAAQALSISLLMDGSVDAAKSARANEQAMRMMAAADRAHSDALDDVAKKEQALQDLREHGHSSPEELRKAQEAIDDARKDAADAEKDVAKAQQQSSQQAAEAQKALDKTNADNARSAADAQKALQKAQETANRNMADAQRRLQEVQGDSKSTAEQLRKAQEDVADATREGAESISDAQQKIADDAQQAAERQADAQARVGDASSSSADAQASAQERVSDANDAVAEAQEAAEQAQRDSVPTAEELNAAERAVAEAKDAVKDAADAQADAVDKAAQSARDMAAAAYATAAADGDLEGAARTAGEVMAEQRQKFIDAAIAAGYSADEAARMADEQGLIPELVVTSFIQYGLDGAIAQAKKLNEELDKIEGRTVQFQAIGASVFQNVPSSEYESGIPGVGSLADVNAQAINHGYAPYNYGPGTTPDNYVSPEERNRRARELLAGGRGGRTTGTYAPGGFVSGDGGPTDDMIHARLSNGEFVVNAAQTRKHRQMLEDINNGVNGYSVGGLVTAGGPMTSFGVLLQGKVAIPDVEMIKKAWKDIATAVYGAWVYAIAPSMTAMDDKTLVSRYAVVTLEKQNAVSWQGIADYTRAAVERIVLPVYGFVMQGLGQIGTTHAQLLTNAVIPTWQGIGQTMYGAWSSVINPVFGQIGQGLLTIATGFQTTATFFSGIAQAMQLSRIVAVTEILAISTAIDNFFKMVDAKAPVGVTVGTGAVTTTAPFGLADGGMITSGTGPRTDDVHVRVSKGEYIVNAKATAAHKSELDQINYGGAYADGGLIGEKIGNRVQNAIVGGVEKAMEFGVNRMLTVMPAQFAGGPVNIGNVEGARGKFLEAVASQMGLPYVWGGSSPPEFDCSGLMSWALTAAGVGRGRLTAANFSDMFPNFRTGEKPGDMAIFDTGRVSPKAGHIGAVLDPTAGTMMHTDGAGPSRVSPYRGRSGLMGFVDPIGGAYVPKTPDPVPGARPGDPPASGWLGQMLAKIAAGGTGGSGGSGLVVGSPGQWGTTRMRNTVDPTTLGSPMSMSRGTPDDVGPVPPGGAVERWRPMYMHALAMLGKNPAGIDKMMYQMFRESSGNPLSYNDTDSNYRAGKPSKGLLQTIPSTFKAHGPAGFNTNIWDPLSNALASLNYIGDPLKYPGGVYDQGGYLPSGLSTVYNGMSSPEPVLTDRQWAIASSAMNFVTTATNTGAGGATDIRITFAGDGVITNEMARTATVAVNGAFVDATFSFDRAGGQG